MTSSPLRRGMKRLILSPKALGIRSWMWGLFYGDAAIQGHESEDVEILKPPEERQPISEPPVEELATGEAFAETTAVEGMAPLEVASGDTPSSKVDSPITEVSSADAVAVEVTSHMDCFCCDGQHWVTTAITSAPLDNDSAIDFIYVVISFFNFKAFLQES